MKRINQLVLLLVTLCNFNSFVHSQDLKDTQEVQFSKQLDYHLQEIISLNSGNVLLVGNTRSGDKGGYDIFIRHLNSGFESISERFIGTKDDEYYLNGLFLGNSKIGIFGKNRSIVNQTPRWNLFYKTISLSTEKEYYQEYVCFQLDSIAHSIQLKDGSVIAVGNKQDWGDRDQNIWLLKINPKGTIRWQTTIGDRFTDEIGLGLVKDGESFFILAEKRMKDGTTPVLVKTDLSGNVIWRKELIEMQGIVNCKLLLYGSDRLLITGVKKGAFQDQIYIFSYDPSARYISQTHVGDCDPKSLFSITTEDSFLYILANSNESGKVYKYDLDHSDRYFASLSQNQKVNYEILLKEENGFIAGGNVSTAENNTFYIQKGEFGFIKDIPLAEEDSPELELPDQPRPSIEVLDPPNEHGIARLQNRESTIIRLRINNENKIVKVLSNENEMTRTSLNVFELEVPLKEGYNDFEVKVLDVSGKTDVKYISIENSIGEVKDKNILDGLNYALIITVCDYQDSEIIDLDNPKKDGYSLAQTLGSLYTFDKEQIIFLENPTREEIISEFDQLVNLVKKEDNILIFYAGHGYWNEKTNIGYWLPSDAKKSNTANWLSNSTIKDYISAIPSKHTLLIADACFSGGIFKTRKAFSDNIGSVDKLYELPSRKAMTSGTLTEVPDKSVFIEYLVKRLQENKNKYISSEELFSKLRVAVLNNSSNVPQYGEIQGAGDEGGDFIFIQRE